MWPCTFTHHNDSKHIRGPLDYWGSWGARRWQQSSALNLVPPGQSTNWQILDLRMTNPASGTAHTYLHTKIVKTQNSAHTPTILLVFFCNLLWAHLPFILVNKHRTLDGWSKMRFNMRILDKILKTITRPSRTMEAVLEGSGRGFIKWTQLTAAICGFDLN